MIFGDRIRQARELAGWTQGELAARVGVTNSDISHLEAGDWQPTADVLASIALATRFPESFFALPPDPDFPPGSLQWRARASTSAKAERRAKQYARTLYHQAAAALEARFERRKVRLPRRLGDPIMAARVARRELGLAPDEPIPNVVHAVEKGGVLVLAAPDAVEGIDALSAWLDTPPRPVILVFDGFPGDRRRWSVAHELGHLVEHDETNVGQTRRELDREADQFAGEFLLPEAAMRAELPRPLTLTSLVPLKRRWKASLQALIRRARDLDVITARQYQYLFKQLSNLGLRTDEGEALEVPIEKPRALRLMAETLYPAADGTVAYRQLASALHFDPIWTKETIEAHASKADLPKKRSSALSVNGPPVGKVVPLVRRYADS